LGDFLQTHLATLTINDAICNTLSGVGSLEIGFAILEAKQSSQHAKEANWLFWLAHRAVAFWRICGHCVVTTVFWKGATVAQYA
jgi:hypothetical protein